METPYRVEHSVLHTTQHGTMTYYTICRTGEGELIRGSDPVLMHRIVELLNEQENGTDIHR